MYCFSVFFFLIFLDIKIVKTLLRRSHLHITHYPHSHSHSHTTTKNKTSRTAKWSGPRRSTTTTTSPTCPGLRTISSAGLARTRHLTLRKVRRLLHTSFRYTPSHHTYPSSLTPRRERPPSLTTIPQTDKIKQTKITGNDNVDKLQDGVADLVGGQVGKNGIGAPAGDLVSKQGINRTERQGKGESGGIF